MPSILQAPIEFNGSIEEFYENYAQHLLIPTPIVEDFHYHLVEYLNSSDPLFLIRQVKNVTRGEIYRIRDGAQVRFTDNSPAWWLHYQLFNGQYMKFNSFKEFIDAVPSHMFDIKIHGHISHSGWSAAHIFDVKDRNTDFFDWPTSELIKRMVRNIHPCNYFFISKHNKSWMAYGQDRNFLSFFYEKFGANYQSIWNDFLELMDAKPLASIEYAGNSQYSYSSSKKPIKHKEPVVTKQNQPFKRSTQNIPGCKVAYEFSRLCFKADLIEPLGWDDYFCVITNECTFKMSKREFYEVFSNVVESKSYQESGIYHYPTIPRKAEKFIL